MTSCVPREVNGKWYPVPCPELVSLTLGFPTEEACASFCEAYDDIEDAWALMDANEEQSYDNGHDAGYEEGHREGYDQGFDAGFKEGLARSAESA